jgi:hypothetical protein
MQELKEKGIVEEAVPLTGTRSTRDEAAVPYQVRYVSRGGTVMQRTGWVTVKAMKPSLLLPLPGGVYLPDGSIRGTAGEGLSGGMYWRVPRTRIAGAGAVEELPNLTFTD